MTCIFNIKSEVINDKHVHAQSHANVVGTLREGRRYTCTCKTQQGEAKAQANTTGQILICKYNKIYKAHKGTQTQHKGDEKPETRTIATPTNPKSNTDKQPVKPQARNPLSKYKGKDP